jgi:hypothetical protein
MLFDCSTYIFSKLHEHILFSMTPQSFARLQEEKYLWTLEYLFWWMDGMFCVAPGVEVSLYM